MDTNTFLAYLVLLLPLLVAMALIPVCWVRERWVHRCSTSAMECHYPIVREAITVYLEARRPNPARSLSGPQRPRLKALSSTPTEVPATSTHTEGVSIPVPIKRTPTVVHIPQPPVLHEAVTVPARHRPPMRKLQRLRQAAAV